MLRFAATLALVVLGVAACSAFELQASEALQSYIAAQGEDDVHHVYYFPCDGVTAREMENLDLNRYQGHWFATNTAFSTSHHIDSNEVQKRISQGVGCVFNAFNNTDVNAPAYQQLVNLRTAINASTVIPGWEVVGNGTGLYRSLNVTLPHQGNNGKWRIPVPIGNNSRILIDSWIVATDYTRNAIWYSCQDIPVPGTADTVREQVWGIQRRKPQNFSPIELGVLRLAAMSRGIIDADRLYTMPTDGC